MRYIYDPLIADTITEILSRENKLSSNELRRAIKDKVKYRKERMRKNKREKDRKDYYTPSPAKISITLEELQELDWIYKNNTQFGKLNKVFYFLTENGKFGYNIGLKPKEGYRLKDAYQWVLRTATLGIHTPVWDKNIKYKFTGKIILGTSVEDLLHKQDYLVMGNFAHRRFHIQELERGFAEAIEEGAIEKKLIENKIRYVINDRLKKFVFGCWNTLYIGTRYLIEETLMLKRFSKKDPHYVSYEKFKEWLIYLHGERFTKELIIACNDSRKKLNKPKDKQILFDDIKATLANVIKSKIQIIDRFERENNKETSVKFENIKASLMYYTCPDYVMDSIVNVLKMIIIK